MEGLSEYGHALVAMAGVSVVALLLSPLSAMRKTAAGLAPGAEPEADYDNKTYRFHRCYANLTESIGVFAAVTVAAILAGAAPFWVNTFASIFLAVRILLVFVHINGIGKPDMGLRSFSYVAGWLMCIGLAVLAIGAALSGG